MPEDLDLIASVRENFERQLGNLQNELIQVGLLAEEVFPIDTDVRGTQSAIAELKALDAAASSVDETVTVDTDVDRDTISRAAGAASPAMTSGGTDVDFPPMRTDLDGPGFRTLSSPNAADNMPDLMDWLFDDTPDGGGFSLRQHLFGGRRDEGVISRFRDLELKMGDFFKVLAGLIPLIGVFIGALPAAIAAIGGLAAAAVGAAGALAAIGGLGLLGLGMEDGQFSMQRLTDQFSEIRDGFMEAFAPIAERLEPLVEDALDGVIALFDALARRADVLLLLRDEFRAFGGFIMESLPSLLEDLAILGEVAAPIFAMFGSWLQNANLLDAFADALGRFLPLILTVVDGFLSFVPVMLELSAGFLFVTGAIFTFLGVMGDILGMFGPLLPAVGALVGLLLTLVTVTSIYTTIGGAMGTLMGILGIEALTLSEALIVLEAAIQHLGAMSLFSFQAFGLLAGLLTGGAIIFAVASMAQKFGEMANNVRETTKQLKNFDSVAQGMGGVSVGGAGGSGTRTSAGQYTQIVDNSETLVQAGSKEGANAAGQALRFSDSFTSGKDAEGRFVRTN